MKIKYFRLVQSIVEEGSLARSSKKLFLTPSALSYQLRDLEEEVGFKIFNRTKGDWSLTREGEIFYNLSLDINQKLDQGLKKINLIKYGVKGNVVIGTECYSFFNHIPQFITKMAVLYPEIDIQLNLGDTHDLEKKLLNNSIDVGLTTVKPLSSKLMSTPIYEDELWALMHIENEFSKAPYLTSKIFGSLDLIIHSFPLESVSLYQHFLRPNGIKVKSMLNIPLTEVALKMVSANLGVICLPKWALEGMIIPTNIVFKKITKEGLVRKHQLVYRKNSLDKEYFKSIIENLEESFEEIGGKI